MVFDKSAIIEAYRRHAADTGSTAVQIAVLTARINQLNDHVLHNEHDHASRRGLMMMVGKRRGLLNYLKKTDIDTYREVVDKLGLRIAKNSASSGKGGVKGPGTGGGAKY